MRASEVGEALPDAALVISPLGELLWANVQAERLFGKSMSDSIGLNVIELVHPDDLQMAALAMESVQAKDVGSLLEMRVRAGRGWKLVEVRGAPFEENIVLSVRDITDRRRWEVAGDEVARFRSMMQNAASLTFLLDRNGFVIGASGGLTRILGHDQEWLEAKRLAEIVVVKDRHLLNTAIVDIATGSSSTRQTSVDVSLQTADGNTVPFALTFSNLLDDPTVEGIVVTGHDVADRVRTERQLRAANSVLAATLESTNDGILVVNREGKISSWNRRFVEMWRIPDDVVEARNDEAAMMAVLDQLVDPAAFVDKVNEVYAAIDGDSHDVLHFKDGRVFERDSLPQRIDGEVVGRVWSFRDVTDQQRLQAELARQALHDALTGLANQTLFRDRIEHALARLDRHGGRLAVMFIDLDNFKVVNDSLGHSAGDILLMRVSERLASSVRAVDTAARLGGDEFAVLLEDVHEDADAITVVERILQTLREPLVLAAKEIGVTASIGIAYGEAGTDADELLRNADLAMYSAKDAGKNCSRVFAPEMHAAALERLDLESNLRTATRHGGLLLHYQPIYELSTGRIRAAEALVRWMHPQRGLLMPGDFVPFAEQSGLIESIGREVLEVACEQAKAWEIATGEHAPDIAVNLSPRQLQNARLGTEIVAVLANAGLTPDRLILEITENALVTDPEAAARRLAVLRELGVRIAVDDFGTGYSSLGYLQHLPIDILKIDKAFVHGMTERSVGSVAEGIVHLAHHLALTPVAEGVESERQAEKLRDCGCELAQGFHLSRPVEAQRLEELLRSPNEGVTR